MSGRPWPETLPRGLITQLRNIEQTEAFASADPNDVINFISTMLRQALDDLCLELSSDDTRLESLYQTIGAVIVEHKTITSLLKELAASEEAA